MSKWILNEEAPYGEWKELSRHDDEASAIQAMYEAFDSGEPRDFMIAEEGQRGIVFHAHRLFQTDCPRCGKKVRVREMMRTYDCHGIPFRQVCEDCWIAIDENPGYDGEYYDEMDECIDYDY